MRQEASANEGPGWRQQGNTVTSTVTGFSIDCTSPQGTLAFPYHQRVCPATEASAWPGIRCVTLSGEKGEWSSPDVGRDVTSVGFSSDGSRLAFGTMGGSLFVVDTNAQKVLHRGLADGEIRCLAVSTNGMVAVGCADLSSKAWLFELENGHPVHLVDSSADIWAIAFSPNGELLATGHETGKIRVWRVEELPRAQTARS